VQPGPSLDKLATFRIRSTVSGTFLLGLPRERPVGHGLDRLEWWDSSGRHRRERMDRSEWFLWFDDGGFRHEFQTVGEERAILKSSRNAARSRRPASICSLMTRAAILLRRSVSSRAERMRFNSAGCSCCSRYGNVSATPGADSPLLVGFLDFRDRPPSDP